MDSLNAGNSDLSVYDSMRTKGTSNVASFSLDDLSFQTIDLERQSSNDALSNIPSLSEREWTPVTVEYTKSKSMLKVIAFRFKSLISNTK